MHVFSFTSIGPLCKNKTLSSARATAEPAIPHRSRTERDIRKRLNQIIMKKKNEKQDPTVPITPSYAKMCVFFSPMPHHQQQQQKDQVYKRKEWGIVEHALVKLLQLQKKKKKGQAQA
jgi:hypothetical protein